MTKKTHVEQKANIQEVAAIVTAMTDDEKYFLAETIHAVLLDPEIGQVILCVEEKNDWVRAIIDRHTSDARLHVLRIPMMNIGKVRNKALEYVTKHWVAFCDGDDVWCPNKTMIQKTYARQQKADLIGTGHYLVNESGLTRAYGLSRYIPMTSSWMVRTEIMKQHPFNETLLTGSDGDWWIKNFNSIKKAKCPQTLVRYRVRAISVSSVTFSKKRKLKLVTLAERPLLRKPILFLTYCLWIFTKHQSYRWMSEWSTTFPIQTNEE
jgi:hypothetical protein